MTRHILTLIALLTGLAVWSAPANAGDIEAQPCEVGSAQAASPTAGSQAILCLGEVPARKLTKTTKNGHFLTFFGVLSAMSVEIGSDRARE